MLGHHGADGEAIARHAVRVHRRWLQRVIWPSLTGEPRQIVPLRDLPADRPTSPSRRLRPTVHADRHVRRGARLGAPPRRGSRHLHRRSLGRMPRRPKSSSMVRRGSVQAGRPPALAGRLSIIRPLLDWHRRLVT
ncbi:hypothetical protein JOM49_007047 [Amycolatopsis magusensis]|uniref:Uncharacterized protein n=1 Tax=Amycolatopsis magusensis TaxID=882444 RepID=A0ABS4Q1H1_9PSEU|nr:hypothetical protein [Amycolatopsis magusensis]